MYNSFADLRRLGLNESLPEKLARPSSAVHTSQSKIGPAQEPVQQFDNLYRDVGKFEGLHHVSRLLTVGVLPQVLNMTSQESFDKLQDSEKILLEPFYYLRKIPGKEIRSKMIDAFNYWLQADPIELEIIKQVVEMLHTASLLIDDIEDSSQLRRGVPTAHKIYGVPTTINSANYVYFLALQRVLRLRSPAAVDTFTDEMLQLHRGQGMEIYWRDSVVCPSEAEYLQMVSNKTGGLFRLAIKLMQEASSLARYKESPTLLELVDALGKHFQIRDDYINLTSDQYKNQKGYCEDFSEGKFSFPIIHSIANQKGNSELIHILRQRPDNDDIKAYALSLLDKTNSLSYTRDFLKSLELEARQSLTKLGGNPALEKIIDLLSLS